ncbi:MAG TPA: cytochrome P450 [Pseudonocardiaceae bacterium]|jgi:cytochrome P450|nr:cytochrome P450 [Pseudonocardiaceae bacterium]
MAFIDHNLWHRVRTTGHITAAGATLWALARSGDLLSQFLQAKHRPADFGPLTSRTGATLPAESFLEQDPPDHTRLRRLVAPAFRPKLIRSYRCQIEAIAENLLDRAAQRGSFDLITDFAAPLPIMVITKMLGIPDVDVDRFARIGAVVGRSLGGVLSRRQAKELHAASEDLVALFIKIERHRHPGDDVLSILTAAKADDQLGPEELVATCSLLLIAGFETTVNLIGNATVALAQRPDQWSLLRDDLSRAPAVVEETLRFDPPVQATVRVPHEPIELAGQTRPPGARVMLMLAAANRDPEVYPDPDRFDITRTGGPEHLAFSSGIHYCLGAALARLEGEVALQVLARRLPRLRMTGSLRRRPGSAIRGFASIPMAAGDVDNHAMTR